MPFEARVSRKIASGKSPLPHAASGIMATMSTIARRAILSAAALSLLSLAALRIPAWQGAVAMSRPGQEDLTFWVNHNGLEQLDAIGEVGFGDMARILMRRRSNADAFRKLRDRFTFPVRD